MNRFALAATASVAALVLLGGCGTMGTSGTSSPARTSAAPSPQEMPYWAGSGVIQSANPAPGQPNTTRLGIRMDNGRMMYVDTSSKDFTTGTRVQLTANNEIRRM